MARETKNDSTKQSARQRARQAMSDKLERARKRQDALASVFSAIDARDDSDAAIGR